MAAPKRKAPWKRANPRAGGRHKRLTAAERASARNRARRAGRHYPDLVDNMREAAKKPEPQPRRALKTTPATRTAAKKGMSAQRSAATSRTLSMKDPAGGLTAPGRRAFRHKTGARLKPGVRKPVAEMTPDEMRRKGSWAVRFYGRSGRLPALRDKEGKPTRFALTAHAWGEPVPTTVAAARRIAAKGRRLLDRYKKAKKAR